MIVVDAANVVGSRPDGWWRDRRGATERLRDEIAGLAATGVDGSGPGRVLLVVEGAARGVASTPTVEVVEADGSGDDAIVAVVAGLDTVSDCVVVTADRELRRRVGELGARVTGPRSVRGRPGPGRVNRTSSLAPHMAEKIWFITGTSRGFGREWAVAALDRGDRVAATARDTSSLDDLVERYGDAILPIELDVTDRDADFAAVARAHDHFGRLDVVVNNAGYGLFGFVEEVSESEARAQIETNVFGALWVTQAALPYLREQRSGHIVQVSSIGGISAFPNVGLYHASKWALEGFSQSLAQEVESFGIHVTLVEPGGFSTDWGGSSAKRATPIDAYAEIHEAADEARAQRSTTPGDPTASGRAILKVVDAETPPLRVFFGEAPLGIAKSDYEKRLATWEEWQPVAVEAQG
ncbi:NADP-dependent 3-hydroxy acid dehydrogenase YdfG [Williamsia serinedens]|uniref:NADP-dependent 3-hydroxy acid dehydrogenase YdfG n=2 Tax=Williamsia serinedens TaxID=391736 RepID=A0ABT1GX16_9NOCA|nr:NADP-dependent 3-hydroxy acid dehydrogenase YdfG [Williamsia serinedens]